MLDNSEVVKNTDFLTMNLGVDFSSLIKCMNSTKLTPLLCYHWIKPLLICDVLMNKNVFLDHSIRSSIKLSFCIIYLVRPIPHLQQLP